MPSFASGAFIFSLYTLACGDHTLHHDYPFNLTFSREPSYVLHWRVDLSKDTIQFAINTTSKGWVGLGLSKTGQMIGSDVITGWIDVSGKILIQDRYASELSLPAIDESQDWKLVAGEVKNGHTIMEIERKLSTCDADHDIQITTSTLFLVWSMNDEAPPTSLNNLKKHTHEGSYVVNLLGDLKVRSQPPDSANFILNTENTHVPNTTTTYWCQVVKIPTLEDRYIYRFEPTITVGSESYVHHMLLYQCPLLSRQSSDTLKTSSMECEISPREIKGCRGTNVMAGWAIGGKGFSYPEDVAYKIGPHDSLEYAILEIHYDNQDQVNGHVDSSGMTFYYSHTAPIHRAGVIAVGHHVTSNMIIPPGAESYEILGDCSGQCTQQFFPKEGINIFGGLLHTHLLGKSLTLRHFRRTDSCEGVQELPYIDYNNNYDTNYQQVNTFPQETRVMPGDTLSLQCFYDSSQRQEITLGGEGIKEEMCLTFLFYYPQQNLSLCSSMPVPPIAYTPLASAGVRNYSELISSSGLQTFGVSNAKYIREQLDRVSWTPKLNNDLQVTTLESTKIQLCLKDFTRLNKFLVPPVSVKCRYNALLLTCPSTVGLKDDSVTTRNLPLALQLALGLIQVFLHYLCITIAAV